MQWDIPGFGKLDIQYIVSDYNGTLAVDGKLIAGVADLFQALSKQYEIHVLTADTFGIAAEQLDGLPCTLHILPKEEQAKGKLQFVEQLGSKHCIAMGNGRNDRLMLEEAAVGICLMQNEGASRDAIIKSDLVVNSINNACELLLNEKRIIATLRS